MLSLLATILSWEDGEREKAGLQRSGGGGGPSKLRRKASEMNISASETKSTSKGKDKENDTGAYSEVSRVALARPGSRETKIFRFPVFLQPLCRIPLERGGPRPAKQRIQPNVCARIASLATGVHPPRLPRYRAGRRDDTRSFRFLQSTDIFNRLSCFDGNGRCSESTLCWKYRAEV